MPDEEAAKQANEQLQKEIDDQESGKEPDAVQAGLVKPSSPPSE